MVALWLSLTINMGEKHLTATNNLNSRPHGERILHMTKFLSDGFLYFEIQERIS